MNPSRLFAMGDLQYNSGSLTDFNGSYANSWGVSALKSKTNPVVGNHEYGTSGAAGYFSYFGDAATPRQPRLPEGLRRLLQLQCARRHQQLAHRCDQWRVRHGSVAASAARSVRRSTTG